MKRHQLAPFFIPAVSAALSLSCSASAWHTQESMKNTAPFSPSSVPAEPNSTATRSASSGSSHPSSSTSQVTYGVEYVPGGIDRVILSKRDAARNLCVQVTLASPGIAELEVPAGKVDLPPNWTVERAILVHDATACGSPLRRWPEGAIDAVAITGSVRWGSAPTEKTTVDLTLSFPARGSKPSSTEKLAFQR
jgi:hypothetical protein